MDNDNPKPTPGQQVRTALAAAIGRPRPRPRPTPEFAAFIDSLDAMQLHIAVYLLRDLKICSFVIPTLVPMIDRRWFEARLESVIAAT